MGLFSILKQDTVNTRDDDDVDNNKSSSSASPSLTTVVQLYATAPVLTPPPLTPPSYARLTYQAVASAEFQDEDADAVMTKKTESASLRRSQQQQQRQSSSAPRPDLGLWNLRIVDHDGNNNNNTATETLLRRVVFGGGEDGDAPSPSVAGHVWTVDLSSSSSSTVEPTVTAMQNALIRHLVMRDDDNDKNDDNPNAQTTLTALRTTQFGLAADDESYTAPSSQMVADGDETPVALLIVVRVHDDDDATSTDGYLTRRHRALLSYHLRRFAVAVSATLVFTAAGTGTNNDSSSSSTTVRQQHEQQSLLTASQLAVVTRAWARGAPVWRETPAYWEEYNTASSSWAPPRRREEKEKDATASGGGDETTTTTPAAVYGPPGLSRDEEEDLVETVLLRAAQYPGHWDAGKDSLWKILPSTTRQRQEQQQQSAMATLADVTWLTELRRSLGTAAAADDDGTTETTTGLTTPEPKKTKKDNATPGKTPNEASAFFESLLK